MVVELKDIGFQASYTHQIPNTLLQTFKHNKVDEKVKENITQILNINPHLNYTFYDDERGLLFLKEHLNRPKVFHLTV